MSAPKKGSGHRRAVAMGVGGTVIGATLGWAVGLWGEGRKIHIVQAFADFFGTNTWEDWLGSVVLYTLAWCTMGTGIGFGFSLWLSRKQGDG
jgi:hypothetical protein